MLIDTDLLQKNIIALYTHINEDGSRPEYAEMIDQFTDDMDTFYKAIAIATIFEAEYKPSPGKYEI